ncbi:DUF892 family protein [Mucilaginibacter robiniae]|uniref:DUF892 family protein n=1 Tax=Mucilaginibacter robiniae TaxID=2728022 RepID=A0A7L5E5X8_9SPHI|nr:DUF892 family protein [Mucilaginibacter robiniae]QJD97174.1 DUF892 family protein [Mucilaginibacter robiniae]
MKADDIEPVKLESKRSLMVKHVLLRHLNTAYFCKIHIAAFLLQIQHKAQLEELQEVIESYRVALNKKIKQLEELFTFLNEHPNETVAAGMKSMTMEALFAIIKQSGVQFEKELTILNYLQLVNAIDVTHVRILNKMAKAIGIPKVYLLGTLSESKANVESLEKLTQKYLTN